MEKHNLTFKVTLKILLAVEAAAIGGFYASYANFQGNIRWAPGAELVMTVWGFAPEAGRLFFFF